MTGLRQLFNNLISAGKERMRHSEAECLEVDDQLEFCRCSTGRSVGLSSSISAVNVRQPGSCPVFRWKPTWHATIVLFSSGPEAEKDPRDQEVRFRVALAGTLRLDVLNIAIAERNR